MMSERVRVRFAPSPTGLPHLGNMRTALFNWLFARHYGGDFIVRIEDTDLARKKEGADQMILEALRWLGLDWDEGPEKGGGFGPYYQSQRLSSYQTYAQRLLEEGQAYRCYCSPERLEEMRQEQQRRGEPTGYDRRCRGLSDAEVGRYEAQRAKPVIRFKVPLKGQASFHDLLRGMISVANTSLDDFVLLKSDGYPTYHLANVVDDHVMEITDVLRADEWIPSTPRHILIYQAFGWHPPRYIHLPLILETSGGKMSKRLGDISLASYRQRGYLPEAIVNYLALLGWSPGDTEEIFVLEELVERFSWERISVSPAIFDLERLNWFNKWYVRHFGSGRIAREVAPFLQEAYGRDERSEGTAYSPQEWRELLVEHVREEVSSLEEIPAHVGFIFLDEIAYTDKARKVLNAPRAVRVLEAFVERVNSIPSLDVAGASSLLQELRVNFEEMENFRAREVLFPIRASLTGTLEGPSLAAVIALLGKERCIQRVRSSQNSFSS
jgi:glutamyl-tRNA synthetase